MDKIGHVDRMKDGQTEGWTLIPIHPPLPPPHPRGGYNKHKLNWHINRNISEIMQVTKRMMHVNRFSLKDGSRVQAASRVPNIHFK